MRLKKGAPISSSAFHIYVQVERVGRLQFFSPLSDLLATSQNDVQLCDLRHQVSSKSTFQKCFSQAQEVLGDRLKMVHQLHSISAFHIYVQVERVGRLQFFSPLSDLLATSQNDVQLCDLRHQVSSKSTFQKCFSQAQEVLGDRLKMVHQLHSISAFHIYVQV